MSRRLTEVLQAKVAQLVGVSEWSSTTNRIRALPRKAQIAMFANQVELAYWFDLLPVAHTRDAWDDTWRCFNRSNPRNDDISLLR